MTVLATYRIAYRVAWSNVACQAVRPTWPPAWLPEYPARTGWLVASPQLPGGGRR